MIIRGCNQIQHFPRKLYLKITSGLKNSPGYVFWLKKLKSDIKIALRSAGIKQLKTENINVVPGPLFCRQFNAKFLLETHYIDDEDKSQSFADTDNEFTEFKHQGKSSNQLVFHLSAYTHL